MTTGLAEPHPLRSLVRATDGSQSGRHVVQAWVASRGLIILIAMLLGLTEHRSMWDMVDSWDAALYHELAYNGYFSDPRGTLMAFFPGFPSLLRAGEYLGVPTQVTGMIISAIGSALAAAALLRMGGPLAAILWLFAPTAVFTVVPYTEAMFCAAAFWAWERARANRWAWACLFACIACTVRVSGVFLIGALAVLVVTTASRETMASRETTASRDTTAGRPVAPAPATGRLDLAELGRRLAGLVWLVPPALVVFGYFVYLHRLTGSWSAWYTAQSTGWVRGLTWPWESAVNTWQAIRPGAYADHPGWAAVFRFEVLSMAVGVVTTGWCLGRRRWAEASWVGVQVLAFSLSYWFFSVNRAVLLWFPLWIMLADLGQQTRRTPLTRSLWRVWLALVGLGGLIVMIWWSWLFFTGHWAS